MCKILGIRYMGDSGIVIQRESWGILRRIRWRCMWWSLMGILADWICLRRGSCDNEGKEEGKCKGWFYWGCIFGLYSYLSWQ